MVLTLEQPIPVIEDLPAELWEEHRDGEVGYYSHSYSVEVDRTKVHRPGYRDITGTYIIKIINRGATLDSHYTTIKVLREKEEMFSLTGNVVFKLFEGIYQKRKKRKRK